MLRWFAVDARPVRRAYARRASRLSWPDLRNARDVGGLPTGDGGRIRERALVRTDNHRRLGAAGLAALRGYGVSRVLDLRWRSEARADPSPLAADECYRLVPACFDPTGAAAVAAVRLADPAGLPDRPRRGRPRGAAGRRLVRVQWHGGRSGSVTAPEGAPRGG
ncbi:tyrosine-protein phosphatase [Micromonospora sp. NPDC000089]|uniref:tyrosine-protein phosphatase n=1 Tax=unclassified Micromonospora TaxID=2617518 RepID=UPI0036C5D662